MKKYLEILILSIILFCSPFAFAQVHYEYDTVIYLNGETPSGGERTYMARDSIIMLEGYEYDHREMILLLP